MRRDVAAAGAIALVALLLRLGVVLAVGDVGLAADMIDYHDRARYLVDHGTLYPDAFRVPAFSVALAGWMQAFGTGLFGLRTLQALIGSLTAAATFALARQALSRRRSVAAGLIVALYPGFLMYSVYLMAEPLFTLLLVLSVLVAAWRPSMMAAAAAGMLSGAATLTRQAGIVIVAALAAWQVAQMWFARPRWRPRRAVVMGAVVLVGAAVIMSTWAIRNYRVFGRWMPLETTSGITFFMSNYEEASGIYLLRDWQRVHEQYLGQAPDEFERNALAYQLGVQRITEDPQRILRLVPSRLGYFVDAEGREHVWLYTNGYFGSRSSAVVAVCGWAIWLAFPALVLAASLALSFGAAFLHAAESLIVGIIAVVVAQHLGIYGDPRFHLPLVPLVAVLAARPWPVAREQRSSLRVVLGLVSMALLVWWWAARMPEQIRLLYLAASPNGSQLGLPY